MLNAFIDLLCSKLCWHNRLVPNYRQVKYTLKQNNTLPVHNNLRLGRYPVTSTSSSAFTTSSDRRFSLTVNDDFNEPTIGSLSTAAMTATVNKSSSWYSVT